VNCGDILAEKAILSIRRTWDCVAAMRYVDRGANANYIEPFERKTLLHEAAGFGFEPLLRRILDQPNVDTSVLDGRGRTAAQIADENAHFDLGHLIRNYRPS
jgi:hypothetical protein